MVSVCDSAGGNCAIRPEESIGYIGDRFLLRTVRRWSAKGVVFTQSWNGSGRHRRCYLVPIAWCYLVPIAKSWRSLESRDLCPGVIFPLWEFAFCVSYFYFSFQISSGIITMKTRSEHVALLFLVPNDIDCVEPFERPSYLDPRGRWNGRRRRSEDFGSRSPFPTSCIFCQTDTVHAYSAVDHSDTGVHSL